VISVGANIAAGVTISNLRVFSGSLTSGAELGAGIFAGDALMMTNVNVIGNSDAVGAGGGLRASSSVVIVGSRFERNTSFNTRGAMRITGPLALTNVTIISNSITSSTQDGGGIRADGGLTMVGGIVQNNIAPDVGGGIYANTASLTGTQVISNAGNQGGGIYVTGALAITDTTFDQNKALNGNGGAIYASNSSLTITLASTKNPSATLISSNSAITNGGGVFAAGNVVLIGNVSFNSNHAANGDGGGIYANNVSDASAGLINPTIGLNSNSANVNRGGIRATGNVNLTTFPVFVGNHTPSTTGDGGAIYADGNVTVASGFSQVNSAHNGGIIYAGGNVSVKQHAASQSNASQDGGCVYAVGNLEVLNDEFSRCSAGRNGGAFFAGQTVTITGAYSGSVLQIPGYQQNAAARGSLVYGSQVVLRSVTPFSNTAFIEGGAVFASATADISATTFTTNTAGSAGGAVVVSGTAWITSSIFGANRVTGTVGFGGALWVRDGAVVTNSTFISNAASPFSLGNGGGAFAGNVLTATQSTFVGNQGFFGSAISATTALVASSVFTANGNAVRGGGILAANVTVLDSRFFSNTATNAFKAAGGGIYADAARIVNTYFEGNLAEDEGAAVYISKTATISQSQFIRNRGDFQAASAVFLNFASGNSLVADSLFDDNLANNGIDQGGAIEAVDGTLTVSGSTFNNNRAEYGGAVYKGGRLNVFTSTFFNNIALCCGGGGALNGGNIEIQNGTFISNYADCCNGGGAVYGVFTDVQNSQFYSNAVESRMDGGAIFAQSGVSVDGSTFENNRMLLDTSGNPFNLGRGGAVYVLGNGFGEGDVTNSTFRRNRANHGGALACDAHCLVGTSLFEANVADQPDTALTQTNIGTGGAIQTLSDLEVSRSRFLRNRAGVAGGAIFENRQFLQRAADAFIQNSLFAENLASNTVLGSKGNAIAITGTVTTGKLFYNTVVSDSLTSGAAIVVLSGTVGVIDNIITNHGVGLERDGGTVFENFNLYFGNTTPISGAVTSGGSTFGGNPLFVSPLSDDYHVQAGSPAIDVATDVLVAVDYDGDTRPIGAAFDIGFDEYNAAAFSLYLPLIVR
jgi:predicted outer membrane repeat protein